MADDVLEGDRLPGESAPRDDSHILAQINIEDQGDDNTTDDQEDRGGQDKETLYTIRINGHDTEVNKEIYDNIMEERRAMSSNSQQPTIQQIDPDDNDDEDLDDLSVRILTEPKKFVADLTADITKKVKADVTQSYTRAEAQKKFWTDFYEENPELKSDDDIVKLTLSKEFDTIGRMSGKRGRDELANLARERILNIASKHGKGRKKGDKSTSLEGSNQSPGGNTRQEEEEDNPLPAHPSGRPASIGDALKERKRLRARAANRSTTA